MEFQLMNHVYHLLHVLSVLLQIINLFLIENISIYDYELISNIQLLMNITI
jgi:hypothetical protein